MDNKKFYQRPLFWLIFLFAYSVIFFRYSNISIYESGFARGWYYGDNHSNGNVESAARFYRDHGFSPNAGLPTYQYNDSIAGNEYVYTHYPPMAEWVGGIISSVTGNASIKMISVVPLLLSILLFFLIYHVLAKWLKNDNAAFLGATLLVLSNYFIPWADDAHQHLYVELCRWGFVFLWWKYLTEEKKQPAAIVLLALLYAFMCLLSFEPYVYIAIIILGIPVALKQRIFRWEVVLLLLVPVFCFIIRLWLNTKHLGGFSNMLADIQGAFLNRVGADASYSELERKMTIKDYVLLLPKTRFHRLGHFFIFPSIVIIFLSFFGLRALKKFNPTFFRVAIVIYLASISWTLVMPQHALIHIFTIRHLGIFVGVTMGFGLIWYKNRVLDHFRQRNYLLLSLDALVITYSFIYFIINTFYYLYIKFGWFYPHFGNDKYELFDALFL
jgi:hypothetical protein